MVDTAAGVKTLLRWQPTVLEALSAQLTLDAINELRPLYILFGLIGDMYRLSSGVLSYTLRVLTTCQHPVCVHQLHYTKPEGWECGGPLGLTC